MNAIIKERVICPNCKRSLHNINSYHYCKEVSIDDIFAKKTDEVILVFDKLLQHLAHLKDVEMSATKNCIVFVRNKTFLVAKPMTKCLQIKFYATAHIDDADLYKCGLWGNKYEGVLRIAHEDELTQGHINYILNSYHIS
jgi:hypothetical protein